MNDAWQTPDRESTFASLYGAVYPDLLRFVQRRAHSDHAEDVVADAFLVVWRRLEEVPRPYDDARAWIFGITRNILLNQQRGEQRRRALGVRLAEATTSAAGAAGSDVAGIVYRSQSHGDVTATVSGGRFALWFPGDELKDIAGGVEVDVTYRDGQTGASRLTL